MPIHKASAQSSGSLEQGLLLLLLFAPAPILGAEPTVNGQSGLISMPDARLPPDGTWRTGLSFLRPYQSIWSGIALFPWLETSFRFTRFYHVPGFVGTPDDPDYGRNYGDNKDKALDAKLLVFGERGAFPSLAVGMQDVGGGTGLFRAPFAVASKRFESVDLTLGYGTRRLDGVFGGVRWTPPQLPRWSAIAEYDAYDYPRDFGADLSGAGTYKKEAAFGVEYRADWYGAKVFSSHGYVGFNTYVSLPLEQREFIPKIREPEPYTKINPRPTEAQWHDDSEHRARLARALVQQDFRDVRLGYENGRLEASLTNTRISSMPRAVGRAARTLLSFAPLEVREVKVTYVQGSLPVATYTFVNIPLLQRYFNGLATRQMLAPYVAIEYPRPQELSEERDRAETLAAFEEPLPEAIVVERDGADIVALRGENVLGGRLQVRPSLGLFLNDPSGAFKYDLAALARYDRVLSPQLFLQAALRLSLYENVSDVTQPSNSTLPHVRTDVAEYKRASGLKLNRLLVNKFYQPEERVYARVSAGIYEEMYSGAGGQVLYLAPGGRWGIDLDANWLKQRAFEGWFGLRDYSTVTGLASFHYRMSQGLTATLRGGRFLAKDEGLRGEIRRRFASGFEVGAWYTVTNGRDVTSPGSPDHPYNDKGVFISMPLQALLTRDTTATAGLSLSPWTRDVGQMVVSPGDLWNALERPVRQMHERDGLVRFGDRDDDYDLPSLGTGRDRRWPDFLVDDLISFGRASGQVDWMRTAFVGAGITIGSMALDKPADRYAERHNGSSWAKQGIRAGDALPVVALGLSAVFALDESRPPLSDAGVAALEAGALGFLAAEATKYFAGRARPIAGLGNREFHPGNSEDRFNSFPSRHTTLVWAAITPYAKEFGANWLYGAAALTNAARVGSREHWLSDTIAGAAIGYTLGHLAWEARSGSRRSKNGPALAVAPGSVGLQWDLQ